MSLYAEEEATFSARAHRAFLYSMLLGSLLGTFAGLKGSLLGIIIGSIFGFILNEKKENKK